jgi:hypothetical protein
VQPELLELLYPLFVHCYLELLRSRKPELAPALFARFAPEHEAPHGHDLLQLAALRTGEQAATAALAQAFQGSRYAVRLSRYAFELLMAFLQAAGDTLALALINEHLAIKLTAGDAGKLGLGLASEDRAATNVRPGRWGLLRSSPLVRALAPDLAAGDGGEAAAAAAAAAALEDDEQGGKKRKKGAAPPPPPPPPPPPAPKAAGGAPAFTIVEPGLPKAAMPALPELFEQRLLAGTPLLRPLGISRDSDASYPCRSACAREGGAHGEAAAFRVHVHAVARCGARLLRRAVRLWRAACVRLR